LKAWLADGEGGIGNGAAGSERTKMYVHVGNLMENPEENCRSPAPGLLQVGDNSFAFFPRVRGAVVDT